ncbi:hypothetical protein [Bartonella quintana]|uniref:Uncharacterized protein n=1 Tax=Bartonella quintana JK 73 TaxID=1402976 RepID=W3TZR5_BARQI|nr:hypothetical protein [Bartonella quintana]ETS14336.1 hypothetical protein Q650_00969 [Bartonella quintana JK 73rel]ETS16023.1 hypothetical protein Q649_00978 [Bartonella quintana JK 73]KEC60157.1 hypothetical protein O93_00294 [Bartonella quintana JK 19]KEC68008.1 hypothetical protein O7Q_01013 [Bartonella quintana JK 39]SQF95857.1 Uncharacterised protein [Bartonella quintana]
MIIPKLKNSLSPGNEQINRWSLTSRNLKGSFNFAAAAHPAIDEMIKAILDVHSDIDFIAAVCALDRVPIYGSYYILLYHLPEQWIARWSYINTPLIHHLRISSSSLVARIKNKNNLYYKLEICSYESTTNKIFL